MSMITSIMKHNNVFISAFFPILRKLSSKMKTVAICTICGVLPIPGRIMVTSMCLDCTCKSNKTTGLLAYLVSHHYYMWSPLEKTIILPMAVLGLTYTEILIHMCIPLVIYIYYTIHMISKHSIDPVEDIQMTNSTAWIDISVLSLLLVCVGVYNSVQIYDLKITSLLPCTVVLLSYMIIKYKPCLYHLLTSIPIKSGIIISLLIILGTWVKTNIHSFETYFNNTEIWLVCVVSFILSFLMGSSGKFSGLCVLTSTIYGVQWFVLFFMVDFIGYLISPFHKCLPIAVTNFKTSVKVMSLSLIPLCIMLLMYGVLSTLL